MALRPTSRISKTRKSKLVLKKSQKKLVRAHRAHTGKNPGSGYASRGDIQTTAYDDNYRQPFSRRKGRVSWAKSLDSLTKGLKSSRKKKLNKK